MHFYSASCFCFEFFKIFHMLHRKSHNFVNINATGLCHSSKESSGSTYLRRRESLSIGQSISLVQVSVEGPGAATSEAYSLSKTALDKWPSHLGERYCTQGWQSGMVSTAVSKLQKGQ